MREQTLVLHTSVLRGVEILRERETVERDRHLLGLTLGQKQSQKITSSNRVTTRAGASPLLGVSTSTTDH